MALELRDQNVRKCLESKSKNFGSQYKILGKICKSQAFPGCESCSTHSKRSSVCGIAKAAGWGCSQIRNGQCANDAIETLQQCSLATCGFQTECAAVRAKTVNSCGMNERTTNKVIIPELVWNSARVSQHRPSDSAASRYGLHRILRL